MSGVTVAVDIGAESGRVCVGGLDGGVLQFQEIHRFANIPLRIGPSLRWNLPYLLAEIRKATQSISDPIASVGVDTWGVDFVLLDESGDPVEPPYHYRDHRTDGVMDQLVRYFGREEIFQTTGIQFLPFNTLYQLSTMVNSVSLDRAHHFLTIPDYLHYELTNRHLLACEFTNATTTQCFDPNLGDWAKPMLAQLSIPPEIFPQVVFPGHVCEEGPLKVILPACHDTGSAVAAIPDFDGKSVWISSGTWSVMGLEVEKPVINLEALRFNMTNEGGVGHTFRLCKNVMGLWLVQECRREWLAAGHNFEYVDLMNMASTSSSTGALFDPDDPDLIPSGGMLERLAYRIGPDRSPGEAVRTILENLAMKYRFVLDRLASLTGKSFERICIVGGGSRNQLLNQLTADVCGLPVLAGPAEATALGNMVVQMVAQGQVATLSEARKLVADSFECQTYLPNHCERWTEPYAKFKTLVESNES